MLSASACSCTAAGPGKGIFEAEFVRADDGWHVVDAVAETGWTGKTKPELSDMLARLIDLAAGWDIADE